MSINRPSFPHTVIEVLEGINSSLVKRLNSDPQPQGLWTIENGQLNLSKPGGMRIVWIIEGGNISRGWQAHGPDEPARCIGVRKLRLTAEIRVNRPNTMGFTPEDIKLAEEVLRALVIVWDQQRPADYDEEEQAETWEFNENAGQREIVLKYRVTILLLVHADPYLFKTIQTVESTAIPVVP